MRVTQLDIAKQANVSQATVSRVLSGDDRVEASLRDRILAVIREHNYQPDVRARSLRLQRTGLIGLVLKRPHGGLADDPFFAALIAGIMDFLCGQPYHLCVDVVTDDASQEGIYDEMLRTRRVDGLILVESEGRDERIALLQRDKFPFVLIGNPQNEAIASVDNDNVKAGEMATRHLLDGGYKRIGMLAGPQSLTVSEDRIAGYCRAMKSAELTVKVWHSSFGFEAARDEAIGILTQEHRPEALVVLDDFMAFGVVLAARSLGIRIPDDIALVGFNDSSLCNLIPGGLTSVSLGIEGIVERAVHKLLAIVETGECPDPIRDIVPCELCIRGSSRPAEVRA
ncbi:LacI family DNA-binding transcriptional regulator [Fimbriimonas ginsengisoli]|uniref:LacI family DNA-binding transcriptional regulator n=1 Tax=Fimbriimonas ginsengisoli TaxID=1005039 RepID=UPI0003E950C1|nr:LacI family DNA-binding transcriptional regulator [Fimbriimonas ginsengisoli]